MNKLIIILIFFLLTSCCKEGMQVNSYILTESEKEGIPYLLNQHSKFLHSNGFEFDLEVTGKLIETMKTENEHCGDDWSEYETLKINLTSTIPELSILLEAAPAEIDKNLKISINNKTLFRLDLSAPPDIDTLLISGKQFINVYHTNSFLQDTTVILPKQIRYSKAVGIIQIIMTNNETYTINE